MQAESNDIHILIRNLAVSLLLFVHLLASQAIAAQPPNIARIVQKSGPANIVLHGSNFGRQCSRCEVVADYGKINYALKVHNWEDRRIAVVLPDIGHQLTVKVKVVIDHFSSNVVSAKLRPDILPVNKLNRVVKNGTINGLHIHEYTSDTKLGEQGQHSYKLKPTSLPQCDNKGSVYADANLVIGRRTRFADAEIVKKPVQGCERCAPVQVKYFVEPTGYLHYQVHIYQRQITGICPNRVRR